MAKQPLVFSTADDGHDPAGEFEGREYPHTDGRYRYTPYRGMGHYRLGVAIRESGYAVCNYSSGGFRVTFEVRDTGEYGTLDLSNFVVVATPEGTREPKPKQWWKFW